MYADMFRLDQFRFDEGIDSSEIWIPAGEIHDEETLPRDLAIETMSPASTGNLPYLFVGNEYLNSKTMVPPMSMSDFGLKVPARRVETSCR
jgi:hypothetical protein